MAGSLGPQAAPAYPTPLMYVWPPGPDASPYLGAAHGLMGRWAGRLGQGLVFLAAGGIRSWMDLACSVVEWWLVQAGDRLGRSRSAPTHTCASAGMASRTWGQRMA